MCGECHFISAPWRICEHDQPHIAAADLTWHMMLMMLLLYAANEPTPVPGHTWQVKMYIHFCTYILLHTYRAIV